MPYFMHIARALLVALVGALATAAVNRFDNYNREKNNDEDYHYHPGYDDHENW